MSEHDIGDRLAAVASQVGEPSFALDSVASRIRRRRARRITITGISAAVVAIVAAASLPSLGARNLTSKSAIPAPHGVWLPIKISVLGQTALISRPDPRPVFGVPAGRTIPIIAQVIVPRGVRVRSLWLGITAVNVEAGGPHGPTGWAPILLRTTKVLTPGQRTFRLRWAIPGGLRPHTKRYLIAYWDEGKAAAEPIIANFVIRRPG